MNHRETRCPKSPQRDRIASLAARLMAEDGIGDPTHAKRKAAQRLGLPIGTPLPDDAEVDLELRTYQRLFQAREQSIRNRSLLHTAVRLMTLMQRFNPYLSGSVLAGTAGRHAEIDIQLFTDSAKDVEIFLINEGISFRHSLPRSDRAEAVLTVQAGDTEANLVIYPPHEQRVHFKTRDGRVRERANLNSVRRLLDSHSESE